MTATATAAAARFALVLIVAIVLAAGLAAGLDLAFGPHDASAVTNQPGCGGYYDFFLRRIACTRY